MNIPKRTRTPRLYDGGTTAIIILAVLFIGTVAQKNGGDKFTLWNPTTWFARKEANASDKALAAQLAAKEAEMKAKEALLKASQGQVHVADEALKTPDQRGVEIATKAVSNAAAGMDQALGVTAQELLYWKQLVADLRSENAEIRAAAEKKQGEDTTKIIALSGELSETRATLVIKDATLAAAQAELRQAFDRENALANKARNMMFGGAVLVVLCVAVAVLWVMAKFKAGRLGESLGGLKAGLARSVRDAEKAGADIRAFLDANLNREEQEDVRKLAQ